MQEELHFEKLCHDKQMTQHVESCHVFYDPVAEYMEKICNRNGWLCFCQKDQIFYQNLLPFCSYILISIKHDEEVLPPKLYLVVFYQVILVNRTRITCSNFRRPSVLLLGIFVVLYHMFIPHGGIVINVLAW